MATVSKFIINRNEKQYLYVEKTVVMDRAEFFVNEEDGETHLYKPERFDSTYNTDEKLSIIEFLNKAEFLLVCNSNVQTSNTLKTLYMLKNKLASKKLYNPSLIRSKKDLLDIIKVVNDILLLEDDYEDIIDHEVEYQRVMTLRK